MNIFFLDENPNLAAVNHHDKHCVKMILETAQLLSTAHRFLDGVMYIDESSGRKIKRYRLQDDKENMLYKATHINHPSNIWVRESNKNYAWAFQLFKALCAEYTHRYKKIHKSSELLKFLEQHPKNIQETDDFTEIRLAMPDEYKRGDPIESYRDYYNSTKLKNQKYTNRQPPIWIKEHLYV